MKNIFSILIPLFLMQIDLHAQNISGVSFDGMDDMVNVGSSSVFDIENNLTLEAWVRVDVDQFNDFGRIIDKFNFVDQSGYNLIINGGHLFMEFFSPEGDSYNLYGEANIQDGQWHHVAGVFSTNELRLYIDGELDDMEVVGAQAIQPGTNTLGIGNNWDGASFLPLHGQIDEVRIWNVARTQEEIDSFKDMCLAGTETGLVGYWRFDENSGVVANDLTFNGNDGDLNNGVAWIDNDLPVLDCTPCPDLFLDVALTNINCFGACDAFIAILDVEEGVAPFSYEWHTGSTDSVVYGCAGLYVVTVTDAEGCTVIESFEIFQPEELFANASTTDETGQGANDGTATASPFGGIDPYEFLWSNGSTDPTITDLMPGAYTVIVTDANFCSDTQTVVVNAFNCAMSLTAEIINNTCFGDCTGSITLTPVNAIPPVFFFWGDESGEATIDSICAGTYFVTVTDGSGCTLEESYSVLQPDAVLANAGSTDETTAGANDGTVWVAPTGGTPPYSYLWSNGAVDSMLVNLAPGDYTVTVSDVNGCQNAQTVTVNAGSCLSFLDVLVHDITCHGWCDGSISVIIFNGVGPFSFIWSNGDTMATALDLCAGTHSVTVTDLGQSCSATASFTLGEPEPLVITLDEVINITDSTASAISISVSGGVPPYAYVWIGPNGFTHAGEDLMDISAGFYTIVVADAFGCVDSVVSIQVIDETVNVADPQMLDVRLYPNPAVNVLHLDVIDTRDFVVQVYTPEGRMVYHAMNQKAIHVQNFAEGLYVIKVTSGQLQFAGKVAVIR